MLNKVKLIYALFLSCIGTGVFAQTISGTISDESTAETLIGANVFIEGTDRGTASDYEGKYILNVEPGTYTLVFKYIGYADKKVTDIIVGESENKMLDVILSDGSVELDLEIVVEARAIERTENALLLLQKKSDKIQDGISSMEMTRLGVSDAASAMTKITGATVQDGKFIYIRGLGDRYSTAQLNGNALPSTDPYRNSAQLDLIPANLLENIITSKTFTPDQPGTFTGGNVNLKTKSYPEALTFGLSIGAAYNTQSSLIDNFLTHNTDSKTDWLGFDDGSRALPLILQDEEVLQFLDRRGARTARNGDVDAANAIEAASESLSKDFEPAFKSSGLDQKIGISFGNQYKLFGRPLGVLLTGNYNRTFSHYDNAISANYRLNDFTAERLAKNFDLNDSRSTESPSIGGFAGLSYKLSPNNSISFNMIYNHNADKTTRFQTGDHILNGITFPIVYETRSLSFRERALTSFQLSGEHVVPALNNMRVEWSGARSSSSMEEPDLRFFANNFNSENDSYNIDLSSYASPTHFFRFLQDEQTEAKLDITLPFLSGKSRSNKIKFGGLYSSKTRDFNENRFEVVEYNNSIPYGGNATEYFSNENTGVVATLDNGRNEIGNYASDQSDPDNSYTGSQDVWAAYGMLTYQLTENLKVIAGARLENTDISVKSKNDVVVDSLNTGSIDRLNVLPTLNMVYALNDKMNVRAAYSNTIARPNMRELAPFNSFEFIGDAIFYGNPNLDQTDITNVDLRWEYFTNPGEIFAISAYYKNFVNPIIKSVRPFTANPEFEFRNVEDAQVYGIELEFRKSLAAISPKLEKFKIGANASFIKSVVQIPLDELEEIKANDPNFSATERQFQGQSPFVLNANLSYQDLDKGIDAVIAFNFFDDRLAFIGSNGTPDIFEKGRGQLDFFFTKSLGKYTSIKLSAKNLLNATYKISSEFKNSEHIYSSYTLGQTFGLTFNYTIR